VIELLKGRRPIFDVPKHNAGSAPLVKRAHTKAPHIFELITVVDLVFLLPTLIKLCRAAGLHEAANLRMRQLVHVNRLKAAVEAKKRRLVGLDVYVARAVFHGELQQVVKDLGFFRHVSE